MGLSDLVLFLLAAWFGIGLLVGGAFILFRMTRVMDGARESSPAFRLLMLPGAMTLWPLVLKRWNGGSA